MVEMVAPGFSVMMMVNGLPAQFIPDVGYTV